MKNRVKYRHKKFFNTDAPTAISTQEKQFSYWGIVALYFALTAVCGTSQAQNQNASDDPRATKILDEWTAAILPLGHFSIGSVLETGLGSGLSAGIDPAAAALGAKTVQLKWQIPKFGEDDWAVSLKYVNLSRESMWYGDVHKYFNRLNARVLRPSVSWSNRVSSHLIIHSFWASGLGKTEATLSDFGRSELAKKKSDSSPPNEEYEVASKAMQFQSIAGLTEDRFQVTAEWERNSGERILLSTRLERTRLEALDTFSGRLTLAQHWTADGLNLRLGAGPQYSVLSGKDLDEKPINATRWLPAADLAIYWVY